jgi:hypothetical protein
MSLKRSWILLLLAGCAPVQRVSLLRTTIPLQDGRFVGPVELKVPRHADHEGHDFEVKVELSASCDPLFTLAFPDGEQKTLGADDTKWQALLRARAGLSADATANGGAPKPPAPPMRDSRYAPPQQTWQQPPQQQGWAQPPPETWGTPQPESNGPPPSSAPPPVATEAGASVDAQVRIPSPTVGRWERTVTETWNGQLEFEAQRTSRCAARRTFTATYLNAFDDTNTVAIWATVPQELANAELTVEVTELIPPKVAPPPAVEVHAAVKVEPEKPRPPMPPPKKEEPRPAQDATATWQPGHWAWSPGGGEWVWQSGYWLQPTVAPALRVENTGAPPVPGCRWQNGRWVWVAYEGKWEWTPGRWTAPPPLVEEKLDSPDPTAPWIAGQWIAIGATFRWEPGRWGRPQPRAETRGPAPVPGAEWIPGEWLFVGGKWIWSPGFYAGTERPPPPKPETIPPRPHPDAVWLAGFWRWDITVRTHVWIDGHWELPPGEGYVWVEEKVGPDLILRGRWELKVRR